MDHGIFSVVARTGLQYLFIFIFPCDRKIQNNSSILRFGAQYELLALLFQKRGPLLEGVFIYFLLAFIKPVRFKTRFARISTRILTVVLTLAVAAVALNIVGKVPYLDKVYDSVMGRFEEIDTSEDSRVEESRVY